MTNVDKVILVLKTKKLIQEKETITEIVKSLGMRADDLESDEYSVVFDVIFGNLTYREIISIEEKFINLMFDKLHTKKKVELFDTFEGAEIDIKTDMIGEFPNDVWDEFKSKYDIVGWFNSK